MKQYWLILLLFSIKVYAQDVTKYVNPFIGTSNYGTTNPGAVMPNGMVSVCPFNVTGSDLNSFDKDKNWHSTPYVHENKFFTGYSHVNLSGVGCPDLGVIQLMPTSGEIQVLPNEYGSEYRDEAASPGYYTNLLTKYNILTEVTANVRSGISRFTFPAGKANILINLGTGLTNESGSKLRIVDNREIEGFQMTGSFCYKDGSERPVYFVIQFDKPSIDYGAWKKMPELKAESSWSSTNNSYKFYPGYKLEMAGDSIGAWFSFDLEFEQVIHAKVGVSYTSIENARSNLQQEIPTFDFNKQQQMCQDAWQETLGKVQVKGGSRDEKVMFYSALYHMNIHPNIINDINGDYPEMEGYKILKAIDEPRYTVFSLWDTYRNLHPFMSLVYPDKQLAMVNSMIGMYKESGWMPKWELNSRETHVMEGDPAIPVITDTYLRGITHFDVETAYEAFYKSATIEGKLNKLRPDIDHYLEEGYVPIESEFDNSVSHALEYYIADWNLSQLAKALGKKQESIRFLKQSLHYKTYFDDEYQMFRPKLKDGSFLTPFDPKQGENFAPCPGFHEGTAWQYSMYVPHDIPGLIKLKGGEQIFVQTLQKIFDDNLFDMTNEPDINYPYLFNFVEGEEWRTQKTIRDLISEHYHNTPAGIPGNDDCGTLSAWLVYSMMGFYPYCPGNTSYAIASPMFDQITIELDPLFYPGKLIQINSTKETPEAIYIESVSWNGKKVDNFFIDHHELVQGGILEFKLTDKPKTKK